MDNYTKFANIIKEVEERKQKLKADLKVNAAEIESKRVEIDTAEITGGSVEKLLNELAQLESTGKELERRYKAVDKPPKELQEMLKDNKQVSTLANSILDGEMASLEQLKENYQVKLEELKKQRSKYLQTIKDIADIGNQSKATMGKISKVKPYTDRAKTGTSGVSITEVVNPFSGHGIAPIEPKELLNILNNNGGR